MSSVFRLVGGSAARAPIDRALNGQADGAASLETKKRHDVVAAQRSVDARRWSRHAAA